MAEQTTRAPPSLIDIEGIVQDYFWDEFRDLVSDDRKKKKLLKKKAIDMQLNWKKIVFDYQPPVYVPPVPTPGKGIPKQNVLFATTFTNKTKARQTCHFTASRTTKTATEVFVESGYTKSEEMGFTLKTPGELFEANIGFSREFSLTNGVNEVKEEEMTWSVDNEIVVDEESRAEASLKVTEEEYHGTFTAVTYITGTIVASFTNLEDNNSWVAGADADIFEIINKAYNERRLRGDAVIAQMKPFRCVKCTTKGKSNFKYGLNQTVQVEQHKLTPVELKPSFPAKQ